jgi:methionyl-tRNA synthetase
MNDFLSGLGGFIKGMQPLMGEEMQKDASMNAFLLQNDVTELKNKKRDVLAKVGQAVFDAYKRTGSFSEYAALFEEAEAIDKQLGLKQTEMDAAKKAAEEKEQIEERERMARTCPNCGNENEPGVKFCSDCGTKLGEMQSSHCGQCGAELKPGVKFCGECGARL